MKMGRIILFPSLLAPVSPEDVLPAANIAQIREVKFFVVEEIRTARRFLKSCDRSIDIDSLQFNVLNEHTSPTEVEAMLAPALAGNDIGVISEAGCPAVADPGADLVAAAQRKGIEVVPLVGPSSILLALMASGFNGQSFTFEGYLPIDGGRRSEAINRIIAGARRHHTHIFIETPLPQQPSSWRTCKQVTRRNADVCSRRHHRPYPKHPHHACQSLENSGIQLR